MEMKIEMFRKLRKEFTHGKLPFTDAWQLAESIVSQSWMLKVDFGMNVNEISLGMPGTMYVSVAPLALVRAVCWTCSQSTPAHLVMWLPSPFRLHV